MTSHEGQPLDCRPCWSLTSVGLLILRVGIAGYMLTHGYGKFQMLMQGSFEGFPDPLNVGSAQSLILSVFGEFVCSILIILGLGTRFAGLSLAITMGVAAFLMHTNDPWTIGEGARLFKLKEAESWASKEPALLYMIPALALVFTGAGRFSLDALIAGHFRRKRASQ